MTTFTVLKGKALSAAIKGRAKVASTFTEREHQLAYSALAHVDEHHDVIYVQRLLEVTPKNYQPGLIAWATAFGKCKYDRKAEQFSYVKSKKSDLPAAMKVAPANYQKAATAKTQAAFDEVKALESVIAKFEKNKASTVTVRALKAALAIAKGGDKPAVTIVADNTDQKQAA